VDAGVAFESRERFAAGEARARAPALRAGPIGDVEARAVALVRGAAPLRRTLAAIAGQLVAQRAWERLGFARLADYARERPGLSARSIQDLAHVDAALRRLPAVEAALLSGALSWTATRLLCRVARPEDELRWVALARTLTARALAREVRASDASLESADDADEPTEGRAECVAVRCAPRVATLFHRARWLARRAAGEHLPSWGCMEAVAAEALSALAGEGTETKAGLEIGEEEVVGSSLREPDAGADTAERAGRGDPSGAISPASPRESPAASRQHRAGLAPAAPSVSEALRSLLEGLADADAFELDARLGRAVSLEQRLDSELALLVHAVAEGRLHRLRGFASLEAWGRERLGISPRKLRALRRLVRACASWPSLAEAFRAGRLSWVRAHAVIPALALARSPAEGRAWLARAAEVSVRRLHDEVDAALLAAAEAPGDSERQMGARAAGEDARFVFFGPPSVTHLFRAALCAARRRLERAGGRPASEGEAAGWLFEHAIATWLASAGPDPRLARAHRVFARDGWRCTIPGCTSYRNLHDHHVRFRSAGGTDALANRTTLCAFHHLRGVHAGRVRVTGTAPDGLRFELGLRTGRAPLVRYDSKERMMR